VISVFFRQAKSDPPAYQTKESTIKVIGIDQNGKKVTMLS